MATASSHRAKLEFIDEDGVTQREVTTPPYPWCALNGFTEPDAWKSLGARFKAAEKLIRLEEVDPDKVRIAFWR